MFASNSAMASDSKYHKIVDGMSVYFGIIPAQLIHGHGSMHNDGSSIKSKVYTYHVLVAIFDNDSGKRITDARLKATITPLGTKGETKKLEPMHGDLVSYGNFFAMPEISPYTIKVEIQRRDNRVKSIVEFTFKRPRD